MHIGDDDYFIGLSQILKTFGVDNSPESLKESFLETSGLKEFSVSGEADKYKSSVSNITSLYFPIRKIHSNGKYLVHNIFPPDISNESIPFLKWLSKIGALDGIREKEFGSTSFLYDIGNGYSSERLLFLIDCGADYKATDKDNKTALHLLCIKNRLHENDTPQVGVGNSDSKNHDQKDFFSFLIKKTNSSYINQQDSFGNTALHYACAHKNLEVIEKLLKAGANVDIKNEKGESPIDILQLNTLEALTTFKRSGPSNGFDYDIKENIDHQHNHHVLYKNYFSDHIVNTTSTFQEKLKHTIKKMNELSSVKQKQ